MSTVGFPALPGEWATPILAIVDLARSQSTTTLPLAEQITRQNQDAPRTSTGHKAPRRTRLAGMYAAAGIVLSLENEPVAYRTRWDQAILDVVTPEVLTSWDFDQRTHAALALRATFTDLLTPYPPETFEARLLASWLLHTTGPNLPRTTARLAAHALEQHAQHAPDLWATVHDRAPRTDRTQPAASSTAPADVRERLLALRERAQSHAVAHARMVELGGGMGELGYRHREMFQDMLTWDANSANDHADTVQHLAGIAVAALDLADKWARLAGYNLVPGVLEPAQVRGDGQAGASRAVWHLVGRHLADLSPTKATTAGARGAARGHHDG